MRVLMQLAQQNGEGSTWKSATRSRAGPEAHGVVPTLRGSNGGLSGMDASWSLVYYRPQREPMTMGTRVRKRDEFSKVVQRKVAERVGYICSAPDCRALTIGPDTEPMKSAKVGEAGHITAASPGGPRYDGRLTPSQRKSIENAIWLCAGCSTLIDRDPLRFPVELLQDWKEKAEQEARRKIGKAELPPQPSYESDEIRMLSEKLADARARQKRLEECGTKTTEVVAEVLALKRQLREGGRLRAGEDLGDGQFLLLDKVGSGGFGTVWRARDQQTLEIVAIKVLHGNLAGDPLQLARFFRGARVMNELKHGAVVRVLREREHDGGWHYFVMEFVSGGDLRQAVLEQRMDGEQVVRVVDGVCDAMGLAHSRGIVHRDIKPSNILLTDDGEPKLTDFDLVGAPDTTGGTGSGVLGTFLYTDPRCADHPTDADARADVYSLGMTVLFDFAGTDLPMDCYGKQEILIQMLPIPFLIRRVLLRAINVYDREERYADARAFREALREAMPRDTLTRLWRQVAMQLRLSFGRLLATAIMMPLVLVVFVPTIAPLMIAAALPDNLLVKDAVKCALMLLILLCLALGVYAFVRVKDWFNRRYPLIARWSSR